MNFVKRRVCGRPWTPKTRGETRCQGGVSCVTRGRLNKRVNPSCGAMYQKTATTEIHQPWKPEVGPGVRGVLAFPVLQGSCTRHQCLWQEYKAGIWFDFCLQCLTYHDNVIILTLFWRSRFGLQITNRWYFSNSQYKAKSRTIVQNSKYSKYLASNHSQAMSETRNIIYALYGTGIDV